jgi:alkylation response protein AidB-like acyl-CoA dehydrogenase
MNLDLTDDQVQIRAAVRELCRSEIGAAPRSGRHAIPPAAIEARGDRPARDEHPRAVGRPGLRRATVFTVVEEIAAPRPRSLIVAVHNSVGAYPIYHYGNNDVEALLPSSPRVSAFSLSEPGSNGDIGAEADDATATTACSPARRTGANDRHSWTFLVLARTGERARGASAFIVENDRRATIGKSEDRWAS